MAFHLNSESYIFIGWRSLTLARRRRFSIPIVFVFSFCWGVFYAWTTILFDAHLTHCVVPAAGSVVVVIWGGLKYIGEKKTERLSTERVMYIIKDYALRDVGSWSWNGETGGTERHAQPSSLSSLCRVYYSLRRKRLEGKRRKRRRRKKSAKR